MSMFKKVWISICVSILVFDASLLGHLFSVGKWDGSVQFLIVTFSLLAGATALFVLQARKAPNENS